MTEYERIVALRKQGLTQAEIATKVGRSQSNISYILRTGGRAKSGGKKAPTVNREYSPLINMFIVEDLLLGATVKEMAETYYRDENDLRNHIETVLTPDVRKKYEKKFSDYQREKLRRVKGGTKG